MADPNKDELLEELFDALEEAEGHLDYCGYGDSWERECAGDLQQRLTDVLERARRALGKGAQQAGPCLKYVRHESPEMWVMGCANCGGTRNQHKARRRRIREAEARR